ncbi:MULTISPECIES: hypothetical protein [unclassified Streptomyces]|uniref:hypothetical protein n=1 Tax=unclassified Streptomyces TaxID=2593676 RepID=UPI00403C4787
MSHGESAPLERIAQVIRDFDLLPHAQVLVAMSGGKDSTFACLALRELGFQVQPLMVDMGYTPTWANRVKARLGTLGFEATCLSARSNSTPVSISIRRQSLLEENLAVVSGDAQDPRFTPCTSCYNSKVLVLQDYMERNGFDRIVFGHHATDAASSLLKSALMFLDRWDRGNETYQSARFRDLAKEFRDALLNGNSGLPERVTDLITTGHASTDEPPIQSILPDTAAKIVRPLFRVWENEIIAETAYLGETESSGCGHTISKTRQTPREIIQSEIVQALEVNAEMRSRLQNLVQQCLSSDGTLQVDARRIRHQLLGDQYKPSLNDVEKL